MLVGYKRSQGSIILRVKILDSSVATGAGKTGLGANSGGLVTTSGLIISTIADNESAATAYTVAGSNVQTITTLGTYAAPTAGKCRFAEVDATNHKGVYEIQLADARFAVSNAKSLLISISGAANAAECDIVIPLRDLDPYTAMPSANANADAYLDRADAVETGLTPRQALRLFAAALAGKVSGGGTTTITIRNTADSKNRIVATVDSSGNRSAVTLDLT